MTSAGSSAAADPSADRGNARGIALMCAVMLVFAFQDTLSKHLAGRYDVVFVATLRYWFMAALAVALATRASGGLKANARSAKPMLQVARGLLLALQIVVLISSFVLLGLIESHAIFAATPLLIAALSGPLLGERVGPDRWIAIAIGFVGVLVILRPGAGVFSPLALVPIAACFIFAAYTLLTRFVAVSDSSTTSFLWTGVVGLVVLTPFGLMRWSAMDPADWGLMALLCAVSGVGHFLLIRVYALAEASAVQPFSYLQLVFASGLAIWIFGETLKINVAIGAVLVVGAGVYTIWRQR